MDLEVNGIRVPIAVATDQEILAVGCPYCFVDLGAWCVGPEGSVRNVCGIRVWAARIHVLEQRVDDARRACRDLIEVARIDVDRYGQAGAHESVTKGRVAEDLLRLMVGP